MLQTHYTHIAKIPSLGAGEDANNIYPIPEAPTQTEIESTQVHPGEPVTLLGILAEQWVR